MTHDEFEALPILVEADVVEGTVYAQMTVGGEVRRQGPVSAICRGEAP